MSLFDKLFSGSKPSSEMSGRELQRELNRGVGRIPVSLSVNALPLFVRTSVAVSMPIRTRRTSKSFVCKKKKALGAFFFYFVCNSSIRYAPIWMASMKARFS